MEFGIKDNVCFFVSELTTILQYGVEAENKLYKDDISHRH